MLHIGKHASYWKKYCKTQTAGSLEKCCDSVLFPCHPLYSLTISSSILEVQSVTAILIALQARLAGGKPVL